MESAEILPVREPESSDIEVQLVAGEVMEDSFNSLEKSPLMDAASSSPGTPRGGDPRSFCTLKAVSKWLRANLLLLLTVVSVVVGAIIGIAVREVNMERTSNGYLLMVELLGFPGEVFLRMLKMLILPLIVFSLIAGLGSLETKVAGSLGWKTVLYYGCTTFLAVVLGLILVNIIKPGGRAQFSECDNSTLHDHGNNLDVMDTILDLIRYEDCTPGIYSRTLYQVQ